MTPKRKILTIALAGIVAVALIGSFILIKKNKELAVEMLEDLNKQDLEVTCSKIDAGILSINYSDVVIREKGSTNAKQTVTIKDVTLSKSPSLTTLLSMDINQGKTSFTCTSMKLPLVAPLAAKYGTDHLVLNISGSSTLDGTNADSVATIQVPELGSMTSNLALEFSPELYKMMLEKKEMDQGSIARGIGLKSIKVTFKNDGGVAKFLAANNVKEETLPTIEKELKKVPAVDYQADLQSFISGSKQLSASYSTPDGKSMPIQALFMSLLMQSSSSENKITITTF
ncbi:MAG: hypothetical protein ACERJ1_03935 [Halodesulfovibrio sp.]|uniref:hypothetical protein n=1 Tax=Halodesulfovibrio sp. TaxID=1912772 RepID=UPI00359E700F